MELIDSGVLIDYTRTRDPKLAHLFQTLPIMVCGVARAELLNGARNSRDRAKLLQLLDSFIQLPIPDTIWDIVGDNLNLLRRNGVNVPFQDVVLATLAIVNDIELWTRDSHFALMQTVLTSLRLFVEPP